MLGSSLFVLRCLLQRCHLRLHTVNLSLDLLLVGLDLLLGQFFLISQHTQNCVFELELLLLLLSLSLLFLFL